MAARSLKTLILTSILALGAGTAQASSIWVDIDVVGSSLSAGQWDAGTLDIVGPESDSVTIAGGYPDDGTVWKDVTGFAVGTPVEDARIYFWVSADSADRRLTSREYAYIDLEGDWQWGSIQEVDVEIVGIGASAHLLSYISQTGQVHWGVRSLWGDFKIDYVALVARSSSDSDAHMPEPSAVALFGVGTLLVAGAIRRRR